MRVDVILRNEWLKARHRQGARVPVLAFAGFILLISGGSHINAVMKGTRLATLPSAWGEIIGGIGRIGLYFAPVVVILLICNEFTWRTARQNLIDGLSRGEWFGAKVLLLPLVTISFLLLLVTIGGAFALAGTDLSTLAEPIIGAADLGGMLGYFLALLGMSSLALMLAFLRRDPGPTIALFFLYVTLGEALVILALRQVESLTWIGQYLPASVFSQILNRTQLTPDRLQQMTEAAAAAGKAAPTATSLLIALTCGYIALFLGVAFADFRRRDL